MRTLSASLLLSLGFALLGAAPTGAAASFLDVWSKVQSYTVDIKVHETKGNDSQDRTYHYSYLKPHYARTDITGGPGKGGGAVWKGGDTVSGHQGGLLSGVHLNIWNGTAYDTITGPYTDPLGATKRVVYLSKTTHFPVRRVTFAGDAIVEDEVYTNLNPQAALMEGDF